MGIIADSGTVFETGATSLPAIAWLDSTHIVIAYVDTGDSSKGKVVCGSTSGVTPTFGTIAEFNAGSVQEVSIARLDDTHFVIAYRVSGDGKCVAGSVSGTTITLGAVKTFESSDASHIAVCGMDATHFVIAYNLDSPYSGIAIGGSISGVTITMGAKDTFASTTYAAVYNSICSLSSTHFVIAYRQSLSTAYGIAVCGTLSGNTVTITEDGGSVFASYDARYMSISALDATHFIIAHSDYVSKDGKVIAGSVSGTTVTIVEDGATTFETGYVYRTLAITAITASTFSIAFIDLTDSYKGNVLTGNVSGTTISLTVDSSTIFENGSCQGGVALNSIVGGTYYAIAFVDTGDSAKGKAILGTAPAIRQGTAAIESVPSLAALGAANRSGGVSISSVPALSLVGNFHTLGSVSISVIASLAVAGGMITQGAVSISAIASLIATWQTNGICSISSVASLSADGVRTASAVLGVDITSSLSLVGMKTAKGVAEIDVTCAVSVDGRRHRMGTVSISSTSEVSALGVAYFAQLMGYTGTLSDGDVLVIDCDEQTVTLNGSNATRYFTGSFPQLYSGTNELRWKSDETPDVSIESKHEPRYL